MRHSLDRLTDAALRRDYGQAEDALCRALSAAPLAFALELAEERVRGQLPRLLAAHPTDDWAVPALAGAGGGEPEGPPTYVGPGEAQLGVAIGMLNAGKAEAHEPERSRHRIAASICSSVASAGWAAYGRKHPGAWTALARRSDLGEASEGESGEPTPDYFTDPSAHDAEMSEWAEVIAALSTMAPPVELERSPEERLTDAAAESLERLMREVESRHFDRVVDALWSILATRPEKLVFELAEERIQRGVARLIAAHPADTWARRALVGADEPSPAYDGPGESEIVSAIVYLRDARLRPRGWRSPAYELAEAVVCSALSAERAEYGRLHPEAWARTRSAPRDTSNPDDLLVRYAADPGARAAEDREWKEIVAALDAMPSDRQGDRRGACVRWTVDGSCSIGNECSRDR